MTFDLFKFCEKINDLLDRNEPVGARITPNITSRHTGYIFKIRCEFIDTPVSVEFDCSSNGSTSGRQLWCAYWYIDGEKYDYPYWNPIYDIYHDTAVRITKQWLAKMETEFNM